MSNLHRPEPLCEENGWFLNLIYKQMNKFLLVADRPSIMANIAVFDATVRKIHQA